MGELLDNFGPAFDIAPAVPLARLTALGLRVSWQGPRVGHPEGSGAPLVVEGVPGGRYLAGYVSSNDDAVLFADDPVGDFHEAIMLAGAVTAKACTI